MLKEQPFYNVPIKKPKIKKLNNVDMLRELPFYDELSIVKIVKAFKKYARRYNIEIMKDKDGNMNDPSAQLEVSKYQITMKVFLSKQKENGNREFATVYFNSTAKTVIDFKDAVNNYFQEIFYGLDNWINEGSTRTIEYKDGEYIDISIYNPLSGSTYIELPGKLKHPKKD